MVVMVAKWVSGVVLRTRRWLSDHRGRVKEAACTRNLLFAGVFVASVQSKVKMEILRQVHHSCDLSTSFLPYSLVSAPELLTQGERFPENKAEAFLPVSAGSAWGEFDVHLFTPG